MFTQIQQYHDLQKVSYHVNEKGQILTCYTKRCFFDFLWDDITKAARGLVFSHEGIQLNNPLPKIFNINEQEETEEELIIERLKTQEYEVLDKCNGHLMLLWHDGNDWINTPKGSWDHEFIALDRGIIAPYLLNMSKESIFREEMKSYTLMFEPIVDYDKHTMYDKQVEQYGENVAVLLCARHMGGADVSHEVLKYIAKHLGCPVVDRYKRLEDALRTGTQDLTKMFAETGREGWVIKFEDGFRVKIKTKDYLNLRYIKDLDNGNRIKKLLSIHGFNEREFKKELPEEYYYIYDKVVHRFDIYQNELEKWLNAMNENCIKILNYKNLELNNRNIWEYINRKYKPKYTNLFMRFNRTNELDLNIAEKLFVENGSFESLL